LDPLLKKSGEKKTTDTKEGEREEKIYIDDWKYGFLIRFFFFLLSSPS
jgi:hypothetical protein